MTDYSKLFSSFDKYAYGKSVASAFTEFLDTLLIPFKVYDTKEEGELYLARVTNHPKKDAFASMADLIGELSEGFHDPLGELYMQKISHGHMGQYFTPEHVCDLMAQLGSIAAESEKSVLDPACGSGRMLLSAAKINRNIRLYGADLDGVCCKMALMNMLLQSLTGEIAHINSLTNEFFTGYHINTTLLRGYYHPWYREFTKPEESAIWLKPKVKPEIVLPRRTIEVFQQGTLF